MSICPKCNQDHHAVHVCVGRVAGKHPKGVEVMRAKALKGWIKRRHARAIAYRERQKQEDTPAPEPEPVPDPIPAPQPSPNWRW